jgi:hypothetical protein
MTFLKGVVDGLSYIHRFSVILYSNQNRTLFLKWSLFSCLQEVANQLARLIDLRIGRRLEAGRRSESYIYIYTSDGFS